jgi:opacity protein-like surface antigen
VKSIKCFFPYVCSGALLVLLVLGSPFAAEAGSSPGGESSRSVFGYSKQHFGLLAGYGIALPTPGKDKDDVDETRILSAIPYWAVGIQDPVGSGWYHGNHEFRVEVPFLYNTEPHSGSAVGVNWMVRYNFLNWGEVVPFVQAGVGYLHLDTELDDQADGHSLFPQGGLGLHYFLYESLALTAEWRYRHISNGGTRRANDGINDGTFLFGISYFLD